MAIQNRRGDYSDFDPAKMVPGEFAVVQNGDPDGTDGEAVYIAFQAGKVKRLATHDEVLSYNEDAKLAAKDANAAKESVAQAAILADNAKQVIAAKEKELAGKVDYVSMMLFSTSPDHADAREVAEKLKGISAAEDARARAEVDRASAEDKRGIAEQRRESTEKGYVDQAKNYATSAQQAVQAVQNASDRTSKDAANAAKDAKDAKTQSNAAAQFATAASASASSAGRSASEASASAQTIKNTADAISQQTNTFTTELNRVSKDLDYSKADQITSPVGSELFSLQQEDGQKRSITYNNLKTSFFGQLDPKLSDEFLSTWQKILGGGDNS